MQDIELTKILYFILHMNELGNYSVCTLKQHTDCVRKAVGELNESCKKISLSIMQLTNFAFSNRCYPKENDDNASYKGRRCVLLLYDSCT